MLRFRSAGATRGGVIGSHKPAASSDTASDGGVVAQQDSTDVGSWCSESESSCCSLSVGGLLPPTLGSLAGKPLEPIPGTPCGSEPPTLSEEAPAAAVEQRDLLPPPAAPASKLTAWTPPPLLRASLAAAPLAVAAAPGVDEGTNEVDGGEEEPVSPSAERRRAREAMIDRARREFLPLKVRPPAQAPPAPVHVDPHVPLKKRLVFKELGRLTAAVMKKLEPGEPAKKRPSTFLLAEPPWTFGKPRPQASPPPAAPMTPAPANPARLARHVGPR